MSVTAPDGFVAAGVSAGIKPDGLDLALVVAEDGPVPAAAVFTRNSAAAAPVLMSRRKLSRGRARAVLLNSGCANAGTGTEGVVDAEKVTKRTAALLAAEPDHIVMCSTGPIGTYLPVERIISALPALVADTTREGNVTAAEAILTTDTRAKAVVVEPGGFKLGGIAKGAAMLRPDMATMLCVLTTDAMTNAATLLYALTAAVPHTFNCLNVDGCESTNDTVVLLSSGRGPQIPEWELVEVVTEACRNLAWQMAGDAEGASRVVTLRIGGAPDQQAARHYGRAIADSALVRSSFYGGDPNWGRILAALGTCSVDPKGVSIAYQGFGVADMGTALTFDDQEVAKHLTGDFVVDIIVG
ncbi:MAG TPA: bifunctional ornithine acetyltransferase/N-acetylglutamate synthase, partial [Acidimicrobiia bacterium]|nr:bifunctional ornithine acetyltransferase/N-acetylglutamate synthase [Acidimicrobiia bacterium]